MKDLTTTVPAMGKVICIGGAAVDRKYLAHRPIALGTSNPVSSQLCFGGVARNVADNLSRLGVSSSLVTVVGDDENGRSILRHLAEVGVDTSGCAISPHHTTAEYVAILQPDGDLVAGLADMAIFDTLTPKKLEGLDSDLRSSDWIFADCNLPVETLAALLAWASRNDCSLALDAVSTLKVTRLPQDLTGIGLLFLNLDEADALLGRDGPASASPANAASALLARGAARVVLACGPGGLVAADRRSLQRLSAAVAEIVDVTGAGDALIAGTLAGMMRGQTLAMAARLGMSAAVLTIEHPASTRPDMSFAMVESHLDRSSDESPHAIEPQTSLS